MPRPFRVSEVGRGARVQTLGFPRPTSVRCSRAVVWVLWQAISPSGTRWSCLAWRPYSPLHCADRTPYCPIGWAIVWSQSRRCTCWSASLFGVPHADRRSVCESGNGPGGRASAVADDVQARASEVQLTLGQYGIQTDLDHLKLQAVRGTRTGRDRGPEEPGGHPWLRSAR